MARPRLRLLSDDDRATLHEQTLRVLADTGIVFNTPGAIDLLAEAGAAVDRERLSARLPRALVEECLRLAPDRVLLAARDPDHDVWVGGGAPLSFTSDGTATFVLDDLTGERHDGRASDLQTITRLLDALPNVDYLWPTVSARDLDPLTANLDIEAITYRSCTKHVQDEVRAPEYVAPLLEICAAVGGAPVAERPVFSAINCTIAPLQHDREMTEASLGLARAGVPIVIMPMPLMGTTAPMSVAGVTVLTMAELLSAVVLFQLAAPGCPLIASPEPALADLRSGFYLCGAPEVTLASLACVEMCLHYGLPTQGPGFGGESKAADYQEGVEGMSACLQQVLVGADSIVGIGTLDGAQLTSLATCVLHDDAAGLVKQFLAETAFDEDACLCDDIHAVGPGGHFLSRRSTRERARDMWRPAVMRRDAFEAYRGRAVVTDAVERAQSLLAEHMVAPLGDDVERHIEDVVAGFRMSRA